MVECEGEIIWIPGYRIAARWAVVSPERLNLQMELQKTGTVLSPIPAILL